MSAAVQEVLLAEPRGFCAGVDTATGSGRLNAVEIIKAVSGEINGGGGGQPFLATAGGKKPEGLPGAVARAVEMAKNML